VLIVVISIYLLVDGRGLIATLRNIFPDHIGRYCEYLSRRPLPLTARECGDDHG
jgi:predicted PurR-regulated permease PerM